MRGNKNEPFDSETHTRGEDTEDVLDMISRRPEVSKSELIDSLNSEWKGLLLLEDRTYRNKKAVRRVFGVGAGLITGVILAVLLTFVYAACVNLLRLVLGPWWVPSTIELVVSVGVVAGLLFIYAANLKRIEKVAMLLMLFAVGGVFYIILSSVDISTVTGLITY
jgi:hypothetical protein